METRLHLIVVWFHWKLRTEKRGELLRAIASKKNFSNLHSGAFVTVFCTLFGPCLQFSHFSKNRWINFFINFAIPRSIVYKYTLQVLRTLKTEKAFKLGLKNNQFSPLFLCLQERPHYSLAFFPSFVNVLHKAWYRNVQKKMCWTWRVLVGACSILVFHRNVANK